MIYVRHRGWKNYLINNTLLPKWAKDTQVSGCPGLMNYVTEGIVVLSDLDYEFETRDNVLIPWNHNSEIFTQQHYYEQAGLHKPNSTIVKFNTGIMMKQDNESRLSCIVSDYEPLNSKIKVMPGLLPLLDIWTPMLINTVFENGHHVVKTGDPIARIFINYAADIEFVDDGHIDPSMMKPWSELAGQPNVLSTFNKEIKKCPFHHNKTESKK